MITCLKVTDIIEKQVTVAVETLVEVIQTVCEEVTETIEEWEKRWEKRCETVKKKVCRWLPWPLNKLCEWVTETVCKWVEVWAKVLKTVVKTVCETITSILKIIVYVVTTIILTVVRIVCFVVDVIVNWVRIIIAAIAGLPEFLLCLLGVRVRKHLHLCVTVLADEEGAPVVGMGQVDTVLKEATEIISRRFNVRLHVHGRTLVRVPEDRLDVTACDASQLFSSEALDLTSDAGGRGTFRELLGCGDDVLDIASELIHEVLDVIFIRDIVEGDDVGCHIPGTDYVIVDQTASGLVLAHEIGHAGDLWHVSDPDNLMNHFTADDEVRKWQVCIFRRSRFVVYSP